MRAIAAVSGNWGIGRDNDLLFHIPEDLQFFHRMTDGRTMVIGRKNLESFPGARPLPNRRHLVLSRNPEYNPAGVEVYHSIPDLTAVLSEQDPDQVWICGGGVVYREFLPYCTEALITEVDDCPEATVFFPDLNAEPEWERTQVGEWREHKGRRFRFCTWTNHHPLPLPDPS